MIVTYEQALSIVQERIEAAKPNPPIENLPLPQVQGRVLAEDVAADRGLPPFHRAIRDGYALRAADLTALPAVLRCVGEVPAGRPFGAELNSGQCVSIMTGAPLPAGADAVVMVEYTRSLGDDIEIAQSVRPWENVVLQGSEAALGARILAREKNMLVKRHGCPFLRCWRGFRRQALRALRERTLKVRSEGGNTGRRANWPCHIKFAKEGDLLRPSVQLPAGNHGWRRL